MRHSNKLIKTRGNRVVFYRKMMLNSPSIVMDFGFKFNFMFLLIN